MPRKPQLTEPVIVERLWANRQHDAVYVTLSTFRDQNLVDIRKHSMDRFGNPVRRSTRQVRGCVRLSMEAHSQIARVVFPYSRRTLIRRKVLARAYLTFDLGRIEQYSRLPMCAHQPARASSAPGRSTDGRGGCCPSLGNRASGAG
jgi:hypothetical protein